MIEPTSIQRIDNNDNQEYNIIKLDDIPEYDIEDYDLFDEKDKTKFISDLERIVRNSFEYRQMTNFLRENMDMNKCSFYENVNNIDTFKIQIELHHSPFTLYDICIIILNKRITLNESLDIEVIAKEITLLHYYLYIGLIPLSKTVHELVHNQYLFIPTTHILGNFKYFVSIYHDYIPDELMELYNRNIEYSEKVLDYNMDILQTKHTYIDTSGTYKFPTYQIMIEDINNRIKETKQLEHIRPGLIYMDK